MLTKRDFLSYKMLIEIYNKQFRKMISGAAFLASVSAIFSVHAMYSC